MCCVKDQRGNSTRRVKTWRWIREGYSVHYDTPNWDLQRAITKCRDNKTKNALQRTWEYEQLALKER